MAWRVADACDHAEHTAKPEIGGAIHPRVFRHRVRVASSQLGQFEPRSGRRYVAATTRAGVGRIRDGADFPACGVAAATRHGISGRRYVRLKPDTTSDGPAAAFALRATAPREAGHYAYGCFSRMRVSLTTSFPCASTRRMVSVIVFPSLDTTRRDAITGLPSRTL
jgi:hypothetical protein